MQAEAPAAEVRLERDPSGAAILIVRGRLDSETTGPLWRDALGQVDAAGARELVLEASDLEYCDASGASLLIALKRRQEGAGGAFAIRGLREEIGRLVERLEPADERRPPPHPAGRESLFVGAGRATLGLLADLRGFVVFVGELTVMLARAARHPRRVRFKDVIVIAERAGNQAIPIIVLIGFLLGLILAFQSAIPMSRFGAQIFVADLLGISLLRELGPLMAAILLAARSGSAFAAELGTMKVNEEIDALTTMGLEPVRFLVLPRVIAAVAVVPVLAMLMNVAGLAGGAVVMRSLGFPMVTYVNRLMSALTLADFLGGIFKALVFGVIVAAIGCRRGLQTGKGAGAVGESTTSSVVTGIILIAIADGIFAVIFYLVGI